MSNIEAHEAVTVVISRQVKPGMETRFEAVSEAMTIAASTFDGYIGALLLKPVTKLDPEYRIVFRFTNEAALDHWTNSPVRQQLISEIDALVAKETREQLTDGIATWFDFQVQDAGKVKAPNKLRMTLVSWLALYPIVTVIFWLFGDFLATLNLPLRTLLVTLVVMFTMSYIAMPRFTKWFHKWIFN